MASLYCINRFTYGVSHVVKAAASCHKLSSHGSVPNRALSLVNCKSILQFDQEDGMNIFRVQKRYAGHSKWQNIKSTKESKDMKRGNLFSRISMSIKMALKEGSSNPISNTKLADALEFARKNNMPKSTINSVIQNSQKTMVNAKESLFEYRGGGGLCLLVTVFTDNPKRPRGYINAIIKKYGFKEDKQQGGVRHMFKERGVVVTDGDLEGKAVSFSDAEDHAIEVGAEEVEVVNDALHFVCDAADLGAVRTGLKKLGYTIESSELEFIPHNPVVLEDNQMESLIACVTKLEELEEVVKVYANAA